MPELPRPRNLAELLDVGLWSSASRIEAGYAFELFGRETRAIPPDVARVLATLRYREISSFYDVVTALRAYDEEANEYYARMRTPDMPEVGAGQSVFDSVYYQYMSLRGSPVIPDEHVWRGMPEELYLVNRLADAPPATLQGLERLGYYEAAAMGDDAYVADPESILEAADWQARFFDAAPAHTKGEPLSTVATVVGLLIVLAAVVAVGAIVYEVVQGKDVREALAETARINARDAQQDMITAEHYNALIQLCMVRASAGEAPVRDCAKLIEDMQTQWGRTRQISPLEAILRGRGEECGWTECWPYAVGGLALGGLAGYRLVHRFGLVHKEESA